MADEKQYDSEQPEADSNQPAGAADSSDPAMANSSGANSAGTESFVPEEVIPAGSLPPMRLRDMPVPITFRQMVGPGIILAGLSLGSGEFILWPYITYKTQFVFFWACLLGITTQYFINMEISRWTLATGETAITGFARLSKHFAWLFLLANVIPHMIPAWSKGAAEMISWMAFQPDLALNEEGVYVIEGTKYVTELAIGGMFLCGAILTAGPVIYNTVERMQMILVGLVLILVVVLGVMVVRMDAVVAQVSSVATLGAPDFVPPLTENITPVLLLGALAFAGCGGTLNLGQSNYIKDKGYGMGKYIGRITSPITGQEEATSELGYHFPATQENLSRWRRWWKMTCMEQFFSFFLTCVFCLVSLTLISYSLLYTSEGLLQEGAEKYGDGMNFIFGEAQRIDTLFGSGARVLFYVMGIAILLTTEFGVLDAASRISTDIIKVNWLRENARWSESRIYYFCLWGLILFGTGVLLLAKMDVDLGALKLFKASSAMSGAVMCVYSALLIVLNFSRLPRPLRMSSWRLVAMIWSTLFFGSFALYVLYDFLRPYFN